MRIDKDIKISLGNIHKEIKFLKKHKLPIEDLLRGFIEFQGKLTEMTYLGNKNWKLTNIPRISYPYNCRNYDRFLQEDLVFLGLDENSYKYMSNVESYWDHGKENREVYYRLHRRLKGKRKWIEVPKDEKIDISGETLLKLLGYE